MLVLLEVATEKQGTCVCRVSYLLGVCVCAVAMIEARFIHGPASWVWGGHGAAGPCAAALTRDLEALGLLLEHRIAGDTDFLAGGDH